MCSKRSFEKYEAIRDLFGHDYVLIEYFLFELHWELRKSAFNLDVCVILDSHFRCKIFKNSPPEDCWNEKLSALLNRLYFKTILNLLLHKKGAF